MNAAARALKAARGLTLRLAATHLLPERVMLMRGPSSRRRVALTFDDGPDELTPRYLETLGRAGARATFFVIGRACAERPGAVEAMVRAGHEVASHGFTHTEFPKLGEGALRDELDRTAALLPRPSARPMVRPPRGVVTPRSLLACVRAGYTSAMWSLDTLDWAASSPGEVEGRLPRGRVKPGEIVLLHEGRPHTLEALPRIVSALQGEGFELVTLSELLAA
jgi:peptidoglycan/xylan/chitin deacetylase (PgdA/CDA1 family)